MRFALQYALRYNTLCVTIRFALQYALRYKKDLGFVIFNFLFGVGF
jgi:hypothetical protein